MNRVPFPISAVCSVAAITGSHQVLAQPQPVPQAELPGIQPTPNRLNRPVIRSDTSQAAEDAKVGDRRTKGDIIGRTGSLDRLTTRVESRLNTRLNQRLTRSTTVIEDVEVEEEPETDPTDLRRGSRFESAPR